MKSDVSLNEFLNRVEGDLGSCMMRDRRDLHGRVRRVRDLLTRGRPAETIVASIGADFAESMKRRRERYERRPRVTYPAELPVVGRKDELLKAIVENQVVVVCGETGSGKTTQLPKICIEAGRGVDGLIGHTQPRRIAARAVASRLSDELQTTVGRAVGYKVRFGDHTSADTVIKLMTDGILLAEVQSDRLLENYDTIIIDEAHERSLNIDFLLGYLKQLLPQRPDLKVVITSATIDPERFSKHFNNAPVVMVSGRTYPVEVRYRPPVVDEDDDDPGMMRGIVEAVGELSAGGSGDVLVFLSGEREIREAAEELRKHHPPSTEVLPLYSRLSGSEQQAIFQPHSKRRVVLATNVAETSLTVPGIKYVVDTGTARVSRYNPRTKVQRLPIEKVSRASADQRKGRCGRTSDGVCIRLYSEEDFDDRPEFTEPEILRTNLAAVILQMKAAQLGDVEKFPFIEMPDVRLIRDGYTTLHELGAIDDENKLTPLGRQLGRLPIDPRLGRMLLEADKENCVADALVVTAALSVQDPRERPVEKQQAADEAHAQFFDPTSDFLSLLNVWDFYQEKVKHLSHNQLRKQLRNQFLSVTRLREWHEVHRQLKGLMGEMGFRIDSSAGDRSPSPGTPGEGRGEGASNGRSCRENRSDVGRNHPHPNPLPEYREREPRRPSDGALNASDRLHRALLTGLLSNVGSKTDTAEYAGLRGSKFFLFPGSALFNKKPPWVMAAELVETTRLYARTAAAARPDWIERAAAHLVTRQYVEPRWDVDRGDVVASERVSLKGLVLVPSRMVSYGRIDPKISREIFIHYALVEGEYRGRGEYLEHNQNLVRQVRALEAKTRRRDLLLDPSRRFAFYHDRLPGDVYNGALFEKWRKGAEKDDPRILFMSMADVAGDEVANIPAWQYPDRIAIGPHSFPLTYVHDTSRADDGMTVTIPLALLNQVAGGPLDWLVPGWITEKVVELIRTLPKVIRTKLVPAPDAAAKALAALGYKNLSPSPGTPGEGGGEGDSSGDSRVKAESTLVRKHPHPNPLPEYRERGPEGPFLETIAFELGKIIGEVIPVRAFEQPPAWLKMNVRVIDSAGKVIASGRDLSLLRGQLGLKARESFAALPPTDFTKDGLTRWTVGDIPERIEIRRDGATYLGFPAFVDAGDSVNLRVLDSREASVQTHRAGVRRLFMLQLESEIRQMVRQFTDVERMMGWYKPLGTWQQLKDQIITAAVDRALYPEGVDLRKRDVFVDKARDGWKRMSTAAGELNRLTVQILEPFYSVQEELNRKLPPLLAEPVGEMKRQLSMLMPATFLTSTAPDRLPHLPRFLKGIQSRLRKLLDAGLRRDQEITEQIRPVVKLYESRRAAVAARGLVDPNLTSAFWMIQELRVSLFAQELKASVPVSVQRVQKQLELVEA